jgi:hydroxyethylthiazole kinase-like uncharacterized protein yjeF
VKVIPSTEMARLEALAYAEGSQPEEFMLNAGRGVALQVQEFILKNGFQKVVTVLCGKGNNAGDAYVAATHLQKLGYSVTAYALESKDNCSILCSLHEEHFVEEGGKVINPHTAADFEFPQEGIILDGIFGTGFHGAAEGIYAVAINQANASKLPIIAIDIPSGLNGQTGEALGPVIKATETLYLGLPKTGFFLLDGWNNVGRLVGVDFGLDPKWIDQGLEDFILLTSENIKPLMPHMKRNRHKYEAGVVVGLAGSPGMPGAAQLSSLAALRGGAGLVRLLHPEGMQVELSNSPYELIRVPYEPGDTVSVAKTLGKATACYIGPGIGLKDAVRHLLKNVLPQINIPCVIDADALKITAEDSISFPEKCVLTPHHGEMLSLFKQTAKLPLDKALLRKCQAYAEDKNVTLVLKGAPTFIFHTNEPILVSVEGDPGMATAGSGDVLTGLITSFLAQGLKTRDAAALAVYMHGKAGARAAKQKSSFCLVASDIIHYFPEEFLELEF